MTCSKCNLDIGTKANPDRLRNGAKRYRDLAYCPGCWQSAFRITAAIIPIDQTLSGTKQEFYEALRAMWIETTRASNWIMSALYTREPHRASSEKLGPMPKHYLYPELRQLFPSLTPQSVTSIGRAVTRKYRAMRWDVVGLSQASLPTFRYPTPFPVHNQSWSVEMDAGKPLVSARIGDKRWQFRLKAGHQFRRQLEAVRLLSAGDALAGELALYKHHDGQILCKMVAWIPRHQAAGQAGVMFVKTCWDGSLIFAQFSRDAEDEVWRLNGDHIERWVKEYDRKLERLRQDRKAEQRPVPSFVSHQEQFVEKQRRRMKSQVQEIAAQLVNYARRRRAQVLDYADSRQWEGTHFQWFALRERIKQKCSEYGIDFIHRTNAEAKKNNAEALETGETQ